MFKEFDVDGSAFVITAGPDGNMWFTGNNYIGRITLDGTVTSFPVPGRPIGLTTGADGALWFTSFGDYETGRITTSGEFRRHSEFRLGSQPLLITRGPEDNLWFTDGTGGIWRVNQAGTVDPRYRADHRLRSHRRARRGDLVHRADGAEDRPTGCAGV
jgi:virginiamycin B lyase